MGVETIWELCLLQLASFVAFQGLQMGISFFGQKETGAERVAMATALRVSFCFFCDAHLWCQVQEHCFNISRDIVHSVCYHFL